MMDDLLILGGVGQQQKPILPASGLPGIELREQGWQICHLMVHQRPSTQLHSGFARMVLSTWVRGGDCLALEAFLQRQAGVKVAPKLCPPCLKVW